MSLQDFLRFESLGDPLVGDSPLQRVTVPTKSGLQWLAVPSHCVGLAFRVSNTTLETLSFDSSTGRISVQSSVVIGSVPAVHVAASPDGRLVAVCLANGVLQCWDVTADTLQLRWSAQDAHSHRLTDLNKPSSRERSNAAAPAGPVRSLQFSPTGYILLLVDGGSGPDRTGRSQLSLYLANSKRDGNISPIHTVPSQLEGFSVSSAAWSPEVLGSRCTLAVGTTDGAGLRLFSLDIDTFDLQSIGSLPCPIDNDDGQDYSWCCTHVTWISENSLATGYCRVVPSNVDSQDNSDDDNDADDDTAEHEAVMYITTFPPSPDDEPTDVGDVVPFFSVPRYGRHVYFTAVLPTMEEDQCRILLVASNVGSDVIVLSCDSSEDQWHVNELADGHQLATRTDENDEFYYPTGLAVALAENGDTVTPVVLLTTTDGSMSLYTPHYDTRDSFFIFHDVNLPKSLPSVTVPVTESIQQSYTADKDTAQPSNAVAVEETSQTSTMASDIQKTPTKDSDSAFAAKLGSTFQSVSTPGFGTDIKPSFTIPVTNFGHTTSWTSSSISIGEKVSTTGIPVFGATSALGIAAATASTPSLAAPVFGSGSSAPVFGSSATPLFGSGASAPSFGISTSSTTSIFGSGFGTTGGFAALAQSKLSMTENENDNAVNAFKSFSKPGDKNPMQSFIKPLIGDPEPKSADSISTNSEKREEKPSGDDQRNSGLTQSSTIQLDSSDKTIQSLLTSPLAKRAATAFDGMDQKRDGFLPIAKMEDLLDELGEGFHGEELDEQIRIMDAGKGGTITRTAFVQWYVDLIRKAEGRRQGDGGGDDGEQDQDKESLDSEDRADREAERQSAERQFQGLGEMQDDGTCILKVSDFPKLIEALGTTYCEEEHKRTIHKLRNGKDTISMEAFMKWYIDWLFGGDEDSCDDEPDDSDSEAGDKPCAPNDAGWANIFSTDKDQWRCSVCMVSNLKSSMTCVACTTPRPGSSTEVSISNAPTVDTSKGASIGPGGFNFGSSASASDNQVAVKPSGFSFPGAVGRSGDGGNTIAGPAFASLVAGATGRSGFSVAGNASTVDPSKGASIGPGGFTFGLIGSGGATPFSTKSSGFSFPGAVERAGAGGNAVAEPALKITAANSTSSSGFSSAGNTSSDVSVTGFRFTNNLDTSNRNADEKPLESNEVKERDAVKWLAERKFRELGEMKNATCVLKVSDFPKLIESLGTSYCEEDHRGTIRRLSAGKNTIEMDAFTNWYVEWLCGGWLFVGDEDSCDYKQDNTEQRNTGLTQSSTIQLDSSDKTIQSLLTSPLAKRAATAFDGMDQKRDGFLPIAKMEDLLDELGEGFHGEELDEQIRIMDAGKGGTITRTAFVQWYVDLIRKAEGRRQGDGGGDDGEQDQDKESLDSEDRADREAERQSAERQFQGLGEMQDDGTCILKVSDFPKLIEALGTTYCEEEHKRTIHKLRNGKDTISMEAFMKWYIDWLFGGDEDSCDDEPDDSDSEAGDKPCAPNDAGWANIFSTDKDQWRCSVCMVSNLKSSMTCVACTTPRPGSSTEVSISNAPTVDTSKGASIGPGGFNFGSSASASDNQVAVKPSGFSFPGAVGRSGDGGNTIAGPAFASLVAGAIGSSGFSVAENASTGLSSTGFHSLSPLDAAKSEQILLKDEQLHAVSVSSITSGLPSVAPSGLQTIDARPPTQSSDTDKSSVVIGHPPMSSKAPTPFTAAVAGADKSSSTSGYPPMSDKAPTPFSAAVAGADKSSSASGYPPMSDKAPTPFTAAVTGTDKSSSASGYPPMSSKAPTPFSAAVAGTDKSSSASGYPPMSDKAPTPFTAAVTGTDKSSSASGYPPMSSKAPTPFSAAVAGADKSSSASGYPPMSDKAPTPFTAAVTGTDKSSSASGYPTMSSKAPTPFSAAVAGADKSSSASGYPLVPSNAPTPFAGADKSSSASGYPPMSSKAPTPFSAAVAGTDKSSSASGYPPMSDKAPTPFTAAVTGTDKSSSASGYPPMSSKAPTPFSAAVAGTDKSSSASGYPPMSDKAPTPFTAAVTGTDKSSSASGYPPMSSKAPTPFSAAVAGADKSSSASGYPLVPSNAPTPFAGADKSSSASGYPPMSSKAPTPVSAAVAGADKSSSTSGYPPMSSKAPTPFSAAVAGTDKSSSASGYPPMSDKAPTPFTAAVTGTDKSSSASGYPPMSSKAPTPFSAAVAGADKSSSASGYPPMSDKAPTPFTAAVAGADKSSSASGYPTMSSKAPTPFSAAVAGANKASSASGYPPKSDKTPTPFSAAVAGADKASSASGYPLMADKAPAPFTAAVSSTDKGPAFSGVHSISRKAPMSIAAFSDGVSAFAQQTSVSSDEYSGFDSSCRTPEKASGIKSRYSTAISSENISECSHQYVQIVSKMQETLSTLKVTCGVEAREMQSEIVDLTNGLHSLFVSLGDIARTTDLERQRTIRIATKDTHASKKVDECCYLSEKLSTREMMAEISLFDSQPLDSASEKRMRDLISATVSAGRIIELLKCRCILLESLLSSDADVELLRIVHSTYKDFGDFEGDLNRIEGRIHALWHKTFPAKQEISSPVAGATQISIHGPGIHKLNRIDTSASHKWSSIEDRLCKLPVSTEKKLNLKFPDKPSNPGDRINHPFRPSFGSDGANERPRGPRFIFSTPISTASRSGWEEMSSKDQAKLKQLSFTTPQDLKLTSIDRESNDALAMFGTNRQKIRECIQLQENHNLPDRPPISSQISQSGRKTAQKTPHPQQAPSSQSFPVSDGSRSNASPKQENARSDNNEPQLVASKAHHVAPSANSPSVKDHHGAPNPRTASEGTWSLSALGSSIVAGSGGIGKGSISDSITAMQPQKDASTTAPSADYYKLLTEFYQKHNPRKVGEVAAMLKKYAGHERDMFAKLAAKYGDSNPLDKAEHAMESSGIASAPFQSTQTTLIGGTSTPTSAPFSFSSSSQMSRTGTNSGTFASAASPASFTSQNLPSLSNFVSGHNQMGQIVGAGTTTGRNPRDVLTEFYMTYNPAKVSEVDKLLLKYRGNEDQMFRNLAAKYKLDPSVFGLPGASTQGPFQMTSPPLGAFGQPSPLGIGSAFGNALNSTPFGSPPGGFGQPSALGAGLGTITPLSGSSPVFGGGGTPFAASTFGSLAQSSPQGFGGFSAQPSTPFGAPRR